MACGQLLSPSIQKEMVSLNIIFTVAVALSLLAFCLDNKAFLATWLCDFCVKAVGCACDICKMIVDCACYVVTKIADTVIGIVVDFRRKMDALSQAREAAASKTRKEKVETLTTAMCEMAKAGVPTEAMTEFVRSERGTQPKEDKHTLSKIILEALKALSAFLKILR